jgi:hypothetical protein
MLLLQSCACVLAGSGGVRTIRAPLHAHHGSPAACRGRGLHWRLHPSLCAAACVWCCAPDGNPWLLCAVQLVEVSGEAEGAAALYAGEAAAVAMYCELCWAAAAGDVARVREVAEWWLRPALQPQLRAALEQRGVVERESGALVLVEGSGRDASWLCRLQCGAAASLSSGTLAG